MIEINKIHNIDALEGLRQLDDDSVDLILTDPPYGVKRDKGFGGYEGFSGKGKPIKRREYSDNWDSKRPNKEYFKEMLRVSKNAIIFGGNYFADLLPQSSHWIVWDKLNTMPTFGDCELLWTNIKRKSVVKITSEYNGLIGKEYKRFHPTQKPLKLLNWIIVNYSQKGNLILDPFIGSGTTAVACIENHRDFLGFEINPEYVKMANKRISKVQVGLF